MNAHPRYVNCRRQVVVVFSLINFHSTGTIIGFREKPLSTENNFTQNTCNGVKIICTYKYIICLESDIVYNWTKQIDEQSALAPFSKVINGTGDREIGRTRILGL